jgi:glycosyltransferase involved in cell wall biosynthesis
LRHAKDFENQIQGLDVRIAFVTPEFITEDCYDGGLANYLARTSTRLVENGHEITVLVSANVNEVLEWRGVRVCRVAIGGAPVFSLGSLLQPFRMPLDWLYAGWKFRQALRTLHQLEPFDIVQYASYTAPALFRLRKVTTVVRLSSYEPLCREAWGVVLTRARKLQAYIEKRALMRADYLFSPSRLVAEAVTAETGREVPVIESPYAPYPEPVDDRPQQELLDGRRYLLFYGSVGFLKGVGTIAEMIQPLLEAHPGLFFAFIGKDVGYQGRPMMHHVWEMAGSCRGRVLYLGKMRHRHLLPFLRGAVAVVLPSRLDNLPNTCIESMAEGKVVIGTRGTSFDQLIEDGHNGLLCDVDDAQGLHDAIEKVLADPDLAKSLGEKAKAGIAKLSDDQPIEKLIDYYQRALRREGET